MLGFLLCSGSGVLIMKVDWDFLSDHTHEQVGLASEVPSLAPHHQLPQWMLLYL